MRLKCKRRGGCIACKRVERTLCYLCFGWRDREVRSRGVLRVVEKQRDVVLSNAD